MMVQALLAMVAVAPLGVLVVDPHLPAWLPDVRLERVRVGDASVDLEFRRRGTRSSYRVLRRRGWVRVVRQPPPQSRGAGLFGRAWAAATSAARS